MATTLLSFKLVKEEDFRALVNNPSLAESRLIDPARFGAYLSCCHSAVISSPCDAVAAVRIALKHAPRRCQRVQAFGLWAHIHRATGDLDTADSAIRDGFFHGEDCPECMADLHVRRAVLRRNRHDFDGAFEDSTEAIRQYRKLGHAGHDLHKNGLASSYDVRAVIRFYMDDFDGAASDLREALAVLKPRVSPALYRIVLANLANALQATGRRSELLEADKYLRKARQLFQRVEKASQERAKVAWITAQVRYQLGGAQPCALRKMMKVALSDFLELDMNLEAVAVASDLMKMKLARRRWGDGTARELVQELLLTLSGRKTSAEVCAALNQVNAAVNMYGFNARDALKAAISALREACGPGAGIACLVTWEPLQA